MNRLARIEYDSSQLTFNSAENIFENCFRNCVPVIKRKKRKKKTKLNSIIQKTEFKRLNTQTNFEEKISNLFNSLKKSPFQSAKTEKRSILQDLTHCLTILKSENIDKVLNVKLYRLMYNFEDTLVDFNNDLDLLKEELRNELYKDINRISRKASVVKHQLSESLEQETRVGRKLVKKYIKSGLKKGKKLFRIGVRSGLSYLNYFKKKQIYNKLKQIYNKLEEIYSQVLFNIPKAQIEEKRISTKVKSLHLKQRLSKLKTLPIKELAYKLKSLHLKEVLNQIKNISIKEVFYKVKNFLMKNLLLFIKRCKYGFNNLKKLILEKSLFFIKKAKERFSQLEEVLFISFNEKGTETRNLLIKTFTKIKGVSVRTFNTVKSFLIECFEIVEEIIEEINELTEEEREALIRILINLPISKIKQKYFKFKKALILPFIEYKTYFIQDFKEYSIILKNEFNKIISKSQKIQDIKNKIFKIKLILLNIKPRFEKFVVEYNYDHEVTKQYIEIVKEYLKRVAFVFKMYSLPILILTKSFYSGILKVAKADVCWFDSYIPKQHLDLILSDADAGITYVPLKFVPKFLQYVDIDFYIFLTYFTLFGTSKFRLNNKELVYHGVLCVAHLVIYLSTGIILGIMQNMRETYLAVLKGYFRFLVISKFKNIIKSTKGSRVSDYFRLRELLSSFSDQLESNTIGSFDEYISEVVLMSDVKTVSYVLTPITLFFLMTLLYNCCYYVIYNKRPHIPIMTKLAKRLTPNVKDSDD